MINKVIIIGNLGGDPEIRYTTNGNAVCNFSVATTEKWRGQDGQMQEQTEWHRVTAWGKLAEICNQYLSKGSRVYIEGKLKTRQYEKDGITRYTTEIHAAEMKMLGERSGSGNDRRMTPAQEARAEQEARRPQQHQIFGGGNEPPRHQPPGYNDNDVPF